jgi:hypothetical protein
MSDDRPKIQSAFAVSLDKIGILASGLCVVHCLALPLVLSVISVSSLDALGDERFHAVLSVFATLIATMALWQGYRRHLKWDAFLVALPGLGMLLLAAFNPHHLIEENSERWLTVAGAVLISAAHILNRHRLKMCNCTQDTGCQ